MEFTTGTLTACAGGEHLELPITIGGQQHILHTSRTEFTDATPQGFDEIRSAIVHRLRSAVLEADASTPLQVRNAVSSKTFEV